MSKPTNKTRIGLRDATYREPKKADRRCETCKFYFNHRVAATGQCLMDFNQHRHANRDVHPLAVCDAWESPS